MSHPIDAVAVNNTTAKAEPAYAKAAARLIPALVFLFVLAWMDRVNVGFAKLTMLSDLKLSEAAYGFGAGIFFLSYFLFEVPSNLLLEKIGARKTLARITILWGLNCAAMAFVKSETWFYILRFTMGMFEAGFFPGVVLYLTYWFPAARRAKINGLFMTSFAIAGIIGGPVAGLIMSSLGGVGNFSSWQWLFILEGIPSVLAGIAVILFLPDRPREASWLSKDEAEAIENDLAADRKAIVSESSFKAALADWRVWLSAVIYFGIVAGNATIAFWTPSIIKETGVTDTLRIGLLAAIPFVAGTIAMLWNGAHSDRTGERRLHCAIASAIAAVGLAATGALIGSGGSSALVALTVAAIGILAAFPVFWTLPQAFLAGTAAAGAIALINSIGNLAGFVAPYIIGISATITGSATSGLYAVAAIELIAAILVFVFCRWKAVKS